MGIEEESIKAVGDSVGKIAGDVYVDVVRPAARRLGTAIETVFKVGLSPVAMLDWGFEHSKEWLTKKMAERLDTIPQDARTAPPNNIAIPAITNIAMSSDAPELRELYAELLFKAMDARTSDLVHPSYIGLISQMSPEEALVFVSFRKSTESSLFEEKFHAGQYKSPPSIEEQFEKHCSQLGFKNAKRSEVWLDNLQRLGLLKIERVADINYVGPDYDRGPRVDTTEYRYMYLTEFGRSFLEACAPPSVTYEA